MTRIIRRQKSPIRRLSIISLYKLLSNRKEIEKKYIANKSTIESKNNAVLTVQNVLIANQNCFKSEKNYKIVSSIAISLKKRHHSK
jgi:hypothetical protein